MATIINTTTTDALQGPSATLAIPFLTIKYSASGLTYTTIPSLTNWLTYLLNLLLPNILTILILTGLVYLYTSTSARLAALETAHHQHLAHTTKAFKSQSAILTNILQALSASPSRQDLLSALEDSIAAALASSSTELKDYSTALDADLAAMVDRIDMHGKMMLAIERNVEQARLNLAAQVVGSDDGSEDGLEVGDDVERWWARMGYEPEDGGDDLDEAPVEIELEDEREMVWGWLDGCEEEWFEDEESF